MFIPTDAPISRMIFIVLQHYNRELSPVCRLSSGSPELERLRWHPSKPSIPSIPPWPHLQCCDYCAPGPHTCQAVKRVYGDRRKRPAGVDTFWPRLPQRFQHRFHHTTSTRNPKSRQGPFNSVISLFFR